MGCPYCELLRKQNDDGTYITKLKYGVLYLHRSQLFRGRCIYVLNRHIEDFTELKNRDFSAFNIELLGIARALKIILHPSLINVAILGNKIRHLHWHLIPRYKEDPNWGNPPWPSKNKILTRDQYVNLSQLIRETLREVTK